MALCVLLISLKDIFNGKILYRTDIEKLTNFLIVGEIKEKLKAKLLPKTERSFIAEQFRLVGRPSNTRAPHPGISNASSSHPV
jgi:hypothetical protein